MALAPLHYSSAAEIPLLGPITLDHTPYHDPTPGAPGDFLPLPFDANSASTEESRLEYVLLSSVEHVSPGTGGMGVKAPNFSRASRVRGRNALLFFALVGIQAAGVLTLINLVSVEALHALNAGEGVTTELRSTQQLESVATYVVVFSLAQLFELYAVVEGIFQANLLQLAPSPVLPMQICMTIYSDFLSSQLRKALMDAKTVVFPNMTLLKFDAFFWMGFTLQFLILVSGTPKIERILTYVGVPAVILAVVLSAVALRYESTPGMYLFLGIQVAGLSIACSLPPLPGRYKATRATLLIFACASIFLLLLTFAISIVCLRNFGLGLKTKIPPYWRRVKNDENERTELD